LVRVVAASPSHAPRCAEIVFAALREHGIEPEPEGADRDVFAVGARPGRFRDFVAEDGDRVVGMASLEPWDAGGWISKIFVAKESRGRGVGKALLEALVHEARAQGMHHLGLTTRSVFTSAIRLYETFGFVRVDDPPQRGIGVDFAYRLDLTAGGAP
jgi:putative acetyltransferase